MRRFEPGAPVVASKAEAVQLAALKRARPVAFTLPVTEIVPLFDIEAEDPQLGG
jgi:hypothetical protein